MIFKGCDFKTFDSDGNTRGSGYAVRMVTDYTDGAALRDVKFIDHYTNAIADPDAVQYTDFNVAGFYLVGYAHNLYIQGRTERAGYIDSILRVRNTSNTARIKGLTIIEHFAAACLIQTETNSFPLFISGGNLFATVSQEAQRAVPQPSPAGTLFGPNADRSVGKQIYFSGHASVPNDSAQNYRLNDLSGCAQFNGTFTTQAGYVNVVPPPDGRYTVFSTSQTRFGGAKIIEDLTILAESPGYGTGQNIFDDGVAEWDIPGNCVLMLTGGNTTYRAVVFISKTGIAETGILDAGFNYTTGELTGTTSADAPVGDPLTVSVFNEKLQIENRTGVTRFITPVFIGAPAS